MKPEQPLPPVILRLDHSENSEAVKTAFEHSGRQYTVIYVADSSETVPSVETQFGVVRGYETIRRYFDLAGK